MSCPTYRGNNNTRAPRFAWVTPQQPPLPMVGYQHDNISQDGYDTLSRESLDSSLASPGYPASNARRGADVRDRDCGIDAAAAAATTTTTYDAPVDHETHQPHSRSKKVVAWKDLPKKDQLLVITLARLSEPLTQTSLQAYMFYQLQWFDPTLPDAVISGQAGILHASFTAAQFFTAMLWGRIADSKLAGRKSVIMVGLLGTLVSCLGFGFSTSFYQALFFRSLGGITNGNIGVMRTMISETIREKKYQSRAFLILPMTFNIGVIVGPILGGVLSDPANSYPSVFGNVEFFRKFPYATPNIVSAIFLGTALLLCWLMLEETHDSLRDKQDIGILLGRRLKTLIRRNNNSIAYIPLHSRDTSLSTVTTADYDLSPGTPRISAELASKQPTSRRRYTGRLPFRRIFTRNVSFTLVSHFFLAFHVGTFNSLWFVFLSTPVYNPAAPDPSGFKPHLPFRFTGGLGLPPRSVGLAMAILGVIGILMQLLLYPWLSARLGTLRSWRTFLFFFPITYLILPFLSVVPSSTPPPSQKTGLAIWAAIGGVLFVQVSARTFALPAQTILVNNCTPHPSVLGTVHGLGQSASSLARTIGPVAGGWLYGLGLSHGLVGGVFWGMAGVAVAGVVFSFWVREGNGHEIWLEGDEEDDAENEGQRIAP
ncbi:major facilitator superfamily domain-containing protein [Xylaria sp. FL1777]|nr:major facilitator superfamily domain-containing protein [Xylaria sp. FL1777]